MGDRRNNKLVPIARRYEKLPPEWMAEKQHRVYQARDGLSINAYLTLPIATKKPFPTIIFPHGGPAAFDGFGFDYWVQFFANRGYAVLQMNFRGSSGYGFDFQAAAKGWGQEMQTDIEDGTRWLIQQGIADPQRICVVGASYGGYAALMEAARHSSLYQCALSFAGVFDLPYLLDSNMVYLNSEVIRQQFGANKKILRENSPINLVDDIRIPVLLAHGDGDRVVSVQQSRRMYKAMQRAGKSAIYLELEGGNHYLSDESDRIELFRAMDSYLQRHLAKQSL